MKKLLSMTMLLTVMFLTFSACSNDDDDVATTYTLSFDVHSNLSSTVRLFEYNDNGDKIGNKSIECKAGDIHTFTADPETYSNHTIFRHANFIGCLSADKIKMPVRKYFCFNIPVYRNMAEEPSCRSPYHEEYIQTSVSGNSEGLCRSTYSFLSERR